MTINNITKNNTINDAENVLNVKGYSYKTYISNNHKPQIAYVDNNLYKRSDNRTFNNTNNVYKHINQYSTDVFNNYKINRTHSLKKTYYNFNDGMTLNKTSNNLSNDTYNIIKNNNIFKTTDSQYFTKKINNTSNITNNIARHNHNSYEHNVIKKVNKHIKHVNNYDTEITY